MSANFWDERYDKNEYHFGEKPNQWIKTVLGDIGPVSAKTMLEIACGEGRNSVYAAELGYKVTATDISTKGIEKTLALAKKHSLTIETKQFDILEDKITSQFDGLILTFLHFQKIERQKLYDKIGQLLLPGGLFIAEWYHHDQRKLGLTSGGPPDPDMLPTLAELETFFLNSSWDVLELSYKKDNLDEGMGHKGLAALCRIHARLK